MMRRQALTFADGGAGDAGERQGPGIILVDVLQYELHPALVVGLGAA